MLILHVSDLHVTEPGQSLKSLWLRADQALSQLGRAHVDYVVVTGDLSQRAGPDEYAQLREFADTRLLPLVPAQERARVIFVPGNHDVDWGAPIGQPVDLAAARPQDLEAVQSELERYRSSPEMSELRLQIGRLGHLGLVRLQQDRYQQRLRNVQTFLDGFYGASLEGRGRKFRLLEDRPSEHFSAHVFPEDGVAFAGFSSVHRNDKWWTGASISPEAVVAANDLLRAHGPDLLRVAVWHHGFSAERGRPDSLTIQDVGMLHAAGFRVGFHGHTHRDSAQLADLVRDRFAIVSTGSFGAGSPDRPDAVGNQISLVRLTPGSLRVDVLEKQGEAGTYRGTRRVFFDLSGGGRPAAPSEAHARLHRRSLKVRADGITRAEVLLEGLTTEGQTPLAVVSPPFCEVVEDELAQGSHGPLPVKRQPRPGGRIAFLMVAPPGRSLHRVEWKYHVSNAVALNRTELQLLPDRRRHHPNLPDGHELVCHTVRFDCDRLELAIEYQQDAGTTVEAPVPLVEQAVEVEGELRWERNAAEERRCRITNVNGRAELSVQGPILGVRYGIAFKPTNPGKPYPELLALDLAEIMRTCLGSTPGAPGSLAQRLSWACETVVGALLLERGHVSRAALGEGGPGEPPWTGLFGNRTTVMGMLWDSVNRQLKPAFGRFWMQSWGARFACGEGVAGHAFRLGLPVAWHTDAAPSRHTGSIIFQRHPNHWVRPRNYRWVLSVPLVATGEAPIGAVTIASEADESGTAAEGLLARIARVYVMGLEDGACRDLLNRLEFLLNLSFWVEVEKTEGLTQSARDHAARVVARLRQGRNPA